MVPFICLACRQARKLDHHWQASRVFFLPACVTPFPIHPGINMFYICRVLYGGVCCTSSCVWSVFANRAAAAQATRCPAAHSISGLVQHPPRLHEVWLACMLCSYAFCALCVVYCRPVSCRLVHALVTCTVAALIACVCVLRAVGCASPVEPANILAATAFNNASMQFHVQLCSLQYHCSRVGSISAG